MGIEIDYVLELVLYDPRCSIQNQPPKKYDRMEIRVTESLSSMSVLLRSATEQPAKMNEMHETLVSMKI